MWRFIKNDFEHRTVRMQLAMWINATPAVLAATLAGGGLSVLPDFLALEHVNSGRLVELLPSWTLPAAVFTPLPGARFRPPKVTEFVAMLLEENKRRGQSTL